MQNTEHKSEIRSLAIQDLDVQKLEERLEMASALPNSDDWASNNCSDYYSRLSTFVQNCNALK